MIKTIQLPCYGIVVKTRYGSGTISSNLTEDSPDDAEWQSGVDAIECLVLAHACAGVDIEAPAYVEGIRNAVGFCADNL
jgi:hypothetical protein